MQPVKITIPGNYWDAHLYMGKLYLWTMDGAVVTYDWRKFIESLISGGADKLAMNSAFLNGSYLYDHALKSFTADDAIRQVLSQKFARISNADFTLSPSDSPKFQLGEQVNPFRELPTDLQIYNRRAYAATDTGLWSASVGNGTKKPVSTRPVRMWDCPILSLTANGFRQITLSAGSDGLFEYSGNEITQYGRPTEVADGIHQISTDHSLYANYAGLSVYNTSNLGTSSLALFEWDERDNEGQSRRVFSAEVGEDKIFGNNVHGRMSWGVEDKIYSAREGSVQVVRFNNYAKTAEEGRFSAVKNIRLQAWKGDVIAGGVAYFGIIIECENALVVAMSDGQFLTIPGPITKWRVYPRSKDYENHLHVVLDDRIEIYSLNHDIFVDQETKDLGISARPEWYKQSRRGRRGRSR